MGGEGSRRRRKTLKSIVQSIVGKYFTITNVYLDEGILTFEVYDSEIKEKFKKMYGELREMDLIPTATREN
ncbi:MAG: hypothetical protein QW382_07060, partial [Nitrososphaerota archaeon]